jgi:hypothetical protein
MSNPKNIAFWIAFPLAVTAVSILAVNRIRQQSGPALQPAAVTADAAVPSGMEAGTHAMEASTHAGEANSHAAVVNTSAEAPPPNYITIPANTVIHVRLDHSIATNRVASGDPFYARVASPVVVRGTTVIPKGAPVKGKVVSSQESGRLKGVPEIHLALDSVRIDGNDYDLHSNTFARYGQNHNKRNLEMIGGGGGGGALLGGLLGGGKGALIGAPIGAGAGATGAALTGKKDIVIPAETAVTFQLLDPVDVRL